VASAETLHGHADAPTPHMCQLGSLLTETAKQPSRCRQRNQQKSRRTAYSRRRYSDWLRAGRSRGRSSRIFSSPISSRPAPGSIQPPIQWAPGIMRPGCEADHSPLASAEAKKMWIYTSTPPHTFMWGECITLQRTVTISRLTRDWRKCKFKFLSNK
jgi:hypothetical protein